MIRLLIVEEFEMVRRGLKEIFSEAFPKLEIGDASNSEALHMLTSQPWDLVLLDIDVTGRNRLDMVEQLKRLRPHTPVLVLSMQPEEELAIRALRLGASGYLNKSRASTELVAAAKKALAGGRYVTAPLAEKLAALGPDVRWPHERLSTRELEVLRMVARGKTIKKVAAELGLSEKTVGTYRIRISQKTGLKTNVELARYALKHRLVE